MVNDNQSVSVTYNLQHYSVTRIDVISPESAP